MTCRVPGLQLRAGSNASRRRPAASPPGTGSESGAAAPSAVLADSPSGRPSRSRTCATSGDAPPAAPAAKPFAPPCASSASATTASACTAARNWHPAMPEAFARLWGSYSPTRSCVTPPSCGWRSRPQSGEMRRRTTGSSSNSPGGPVSPAPVPTPPLRGGVVAPRRSRSPFATQKSSTRRSDGVSSVPPWDNSVPRWDGVTSGLSHRGTTDKGDIA